MAYLDIYCMHCGAFHFNGPKPSRCPRCGMFQIVVTPHSYDIDRRFKNERENMLKRMDLEQ